MRLTKLSNAAAAAATAASYKLVRGFCAVVVVYMLLMMTGLTAGYHCRAMICFSHLPLGAYVVAVAVAIISLRLLTWLCYCCIQTHKLGVFV